ncbi:MAG: hypothetical protein JWO02_2984 [Solirubrobacterales bacterium]|nr:hypothetical protein [Solirubrobacterales bacterium]
MIATVDTSQHLFWITSRAAGIIALLLASFAVCAGLLMSMRVVRGTRAGDLRVLHEVLSLGTIAALAIHALSLVGDAFLHPSIADVLVPFVSSNQRWWTSLGIIAAWSLTLLGISYYFRARIGQARWRTAHRFTALAWLMGVGHSLGEGTDAGTNWFLAMIAIAVLPPLVLLTARLAGVQRPVKGRAGVAAASGAATRPQRHQPVR